MGNHSKEDVEKLHQHVTEAMKQFASNIAKDQLCLTCGLQILVLDAMMNHFMQGIMQAEDQTVSSDDLLSYSQFIHMRFCEFMIRIDKDQDSVKFYEIDAQGDVVPEKKNMI